MRADDYLTGADILVVDDDPVVRTLVGRILSQAGARVRSASDAEEGLRLFRERSPDLVLLDIHMPEMDGLEAARRIRAAEQSAGTLVPCTIAMLTAEEEASSIVEALNVGADDFLSKPFSRSILVARAGGLLRIRRGGERIEGLLRGRQRMAEALVHDLRNPLSAIRLNSWLLDEGPGDGFQEAVTAIQQAAGEMSGLLDDLLLAARSEAVGLAPELRETSLTELVELAVARARRLLPRSEKRVEIVSTRRPGAEEDGALLDDKLMGRVLDNLLGNAVAYGTPEGGSIRVAAFNGECVRIEVEDDGPGVPEAEREQIFRRFARGDGVGVGGFGIGLSFCRAAVTAHGGEIRAEDGASGGARFVVEIPTAARALDPS